MQTLIIYKIIDSLGKYQMNDVSTDKIFLSKSFHVCSGDCSYQQVAEEQMELLKDQGECRKGGMRCERTCTNNLEPGECTEELVDVCEDVPEEVCETVSEKHCKTVQEQVCDENKQEPQTM